MQARLENLEIKLKEVTSEVVDSQQALNNISKDIHIMSQTSVRMEQALSKLLETEVKFQLHSQKVEQNALENSRLFKSVFSRIELLEKHGSEVDATLYQSCDIKSQEISAMGKEVVKTTTELTNQNFRYTLYLLGIMFSLFLSYMAYVDNQNGALSDRIAIRESVSVKNGTNIVGIQEDIREVHNDIKDLRREILSALKGEN